MKSKTKIFAIYLFAFMLTVTIAVGQEKEGYNMVEITYMLPKIGMEKAFTDAVKEHNDKYHKEGPTKAHLDYIMTGKESGWFVWIMGPCTFSDLDNRPNDDGHRAHWDKNISPKVAKYGKTEYWRHNSKLSYSGDSSEMPKYENIWFINVKKGQSYKFNEFIKKVKKAYEKKGKGNFGVYNNQFVEDSKGRDVAIVWTFNKWAEMDDDDGGIKKSFEEIYGEGSWTNALKDWEASTQSIDSQVWEINVN